MSYDIDDSDLRPRMTPLAELTLAQRAMQYYLERPFELAFWRRVFGRPQAEGHLQEGR
jgi:hypothetical protein